MLYYWLSVRVLAPCLTTNRIFTVYIHVYRRVTSVHTVCHAYMLYTFTLCIIFNKMNSTCVCECTEQTIKHNSVCKVVQYFIVRLQSFICVYTRCVIEDCAFKTVTFLFSFPVPLVFPKLNINLVFFCFRSFFCYFKHKIKSLRLIVLSKRARIPIFILLFFFFTFCFCVSSPVLHYYWNCRRRRCYSFLCIFFLFIFVVCIK